jgi:hypothetical protein
MSNLPELKPGEWQFANDYTAIWVRVPHTENHVGLVRLPIVLGDPGTEKAWGWDGNKEAPTLTPSINVIGIWHGWLQAGKLITA